MIYTLANPVTIGDLANRLTISQFRLASIAINFQDAYAKNGNAHMTVIVEDVATGHPIAIHYDGTAAAGDPTALAFWRQLDGVSNAATKAIFAKLQADGKLPPGTLA